jgi:hypothetical protein
MDLSPFTLVRSRRSEASGAAPEMRPEASEIAKTKLGSKLISSLAGRQQALDEVVRRSESVSETVGIWDLGAWVGELPQIIEAMNDAQEQLRFFDVHAAVPASITSSKRRVVEWAEATLGKHLSARQKEYITDAIIDVEFFDLAEPVRQDLGVDYLIAVSPDAIAGEEKDQEGHVVHSDFFCSAQDRTSVVSTVGLRELADKADRTFGFAVGFVIASVIFSTLNGSRVDYHKKDQQCLMDYNYHRENIADRLAKPTICDDCLRKSKPEVLEIAAALLKSLDECPRPDAVKARV